jgi:hypothetical protein
VINSVECERCHDIYSLSILVRGEEEAREQWAEMDRPEHPGSYVYQTPELSRVAAGFHDAAVPEPCPCQEDECCEECRPADPFAQRWAEAEAKEAAEGGKPTSDARPIAPVCGDTDGDGDCPACCKSGSYRCPEGTATQTVGAGSDRPEPEGTRADSLRVDWRPPTNLPPDGYAVEVEVGRSFSPDSVVLLGRRRGDSVSGGRPDGGVWGCPWADVRRWRWAKTEATVAKEAAYEAPERPWHSAAISCPPEGEVIVAEFRDGSMPWRCQRSGGQLLVRDAVIGPWSDVSRWRRAEEPRRATSAPAETMQQELERLRALERRVLAKYERGGGA